MIHSNPNIDPEFKSFEEAIDSAKRLATTMQVAMTVVTEVTEHRLGFHCLTSDGYATMREQRLTRHLAPVASALPNGTVDRYPPFSTGGATMSNRRYLIFKFEKTNQWWGPHRSGYVSKVADAGRYTAEETLDILCNSLPPGRCHPVMESEAADDKWPARSFNREVPNV